MKFTLENMESLKQKTHSDLEKECCTYIISRWNDYDNPKSIVMSVLEHGCVLGIVSSLIYYDDTVLFYLEHKKEINGLLYKAFEECGMYSPTEIFSRWDEEDPLALGKYNRNELAWFGFEETLRSVALQFEDFQDLL